MAVVVPVVMVAAPVDLAARLVASAVAARRTVLSGCPATTQADARRGRSRPDRVATRP